MLVGCPDPSTTCNVTSSFSTDLPQHFSTLVSLPPSCARPAQLLALVAPFACQHPFLAFDSTMGDSSHPQQAGPVQVSPHIKLQPPLSRLGHGPGLVLVLDHYALMEKSEKHVDPPPLQKWAEEGFAVAQMLVPGKAEDGGEFNLQKAIDALTELEGCDKGPIGVICTSMHLSGVLGRKLCCSAAFWGPGVVAA